MIPRPRDRLSSRRRRLKNKRQKSLPPAPRRVSTARASRRVAHSRVGRSIGRSIVSDRPTDRPTARKEVPGFETKKLGTPTQTREGNEWMRRDANRRFERASARRVPGADRDRSEARERKDTRCFLTSSDERRRARTIGTDDIIVIIVSRSRSSRIVAERSMVRRLGRRRSS